MSYINMQLEKIDTLMDLDRYKQAIELALKHLYGDHEYQDDLYDKIIDSYFCLGEFDKALKFTKDALGKFPNDYRFHEQLAEIYFYQNSHTKALKEIDKALSLSPNNAYSFYTKAMILEVCDRYEEALTSIEKALKYFPNTVVYLELKARILFNQDSKNEYKEDAYKAIVDKILSLDPNNALAFRLLGRGQNSFKLKKEYFLKALKFNPFDIETQSALKEYKVDIFIFIVSLLLVAISTYLKLFYSVDEIFFYISNTLVTCGIIWLSYYSFYPFLIALLLFSPYIFTQTKILSGSIILVANSFVAVRLSGYIRKWIDEIVLKIDDLKTAYEYYTKEEKNQMLKDSIKSIVFFLLSFIYFAFFKNILLNLPSMVLFFILPFLIVKISGEKFKDTEIVTNFLVILFMKIVAFLFMLFVSKYMIFELNYLIAFSFAMRFRKAVKNWA